MSIFLQNYGLSSNSLAWMALTATGAPYAEQHWAASFHPPSPLIIRWGHRLIAFVEWMPLAGLPAAVLERIVFYIRQRFLNQPNKPCAPFLPVSIGATSCPSSKKRENWAPRNCAMELGVVKMRKNFLKSLKENGVPLSAQEGHVYLDDNQNAPLSGLGWTTAIGARGGEYPLGGKIVDQMNDGHFIAKKDKGILVGVLDGQGPGFGVQASYICEGGYIDKKEGPGWVGYGDRMVKIVKERFPGLFFSKLQALHGNVHSALEHSIFEIQDVISQLGFLDQLSTTAVICYIDLKENLIYTATIGDLQAHIYRECNKKIYSVPLSCFRNWSCPKEAERAAHALTSDKNTGYQTSSYNRLVEEFVQSKTPMFYCHQSMSSSLSRALGSVYFRIEGIPWAISPKPKITMTRLRNHDTLVMGSSGFKDFVEQAEVLTEMAAQSSHSLQEFTSSLMGLVIRNQKKSKHYRRDITVVVLRFGCPLGTADVKADS